MTLSRTQSWVKTLTLFHTQDLERVKTRRCCTRLGHLLNTGPAASRSQRCACYTRIARWRLPAKSLCSVCQATVARHIQVSKRITTPAKSKSNKNTQGWRKTGNASCRARCSAEPARDLVEKVVGSRGVYPERFLGVFKTSPTLWLLKRGRGPSRSNSSPGASFCSSSFRALCTSSFPVGYLQ